MKKYLLFLLFIIFISTSMSGQETVPIIKPDRPYFTNTPNVLSLGAVQIESGISSSFEKFDDLNPAVEISRINFLSTLVRVGIAGNLELRFGGGYLLERIKTEESNLNGKGLNDLMIGAKYQLMSSEKYLADAAIGIEINLPFGSSDFKPEKAEPKVFLAIGRNISNTVSVSFNVGAQYKSNVDDYLKIYGINCDFEIFDRIGIFVEHYGKFYKLSSPNYFIDAGLTYLHKSNLKVSLFFGQELTANANLWFMGAGFSLRLPD